MANMIPAVAHGIESLRLFLARERIRRALLKRSDRALEDIGLSRELLERGVGAWPWRIDAASGAVPAAPIARLSNRLRLRRAFRELDALGDRQPADADITRDGIADVLRNGRIDAGSAAAWELAGLVTTGPSCSGAAGSPSSQEPDAPQPDFPKNAP